MNIKKLISSILAGACAFSCMSFAVSAADAVQASIPEPSYVNESKMRYAISAMVQYPYIDVTIPAANSMGVILNPYGLQYDDVAETCDIYSDYYEIINNSLVNIDVTVNASGTPKGNVKLKKEPPLATSTYNDVYMFIYGQVGTPPSTAAAITTMPATGAAVVTLTGKDTKIFTLNHSDKATGYLAFGGLLNKSSTLKKPWSEIDGVSVRIVIKIEPSTLDV